MPRRRSTFNVALEASAGQGRHASGRSLCHLLRAGVDPSNILAITFTRKAARKCANRIMAALRAAAARGDIAPRAGGSCAIAPATCRQHESMLLPLAAARVFLGGRPRSRLFRGRRHRALPRLVDEALDRTLRYCRAAARDDEHVALAFSQLGERRARAGLAGLLNRRIVAPAVLAKYLAGGAADLDVATASRRAGAALIAVLDSMRGGFDGFLESGPLEPAFLLLSRNLRQLRASVNREATLEAALDPAAVQTTFTRTREHFLTQDGTRHEVPYPKRRSPSTQTGAPTGIWS